MTMKTTKILLLLLSAATYTSGASVNRSTKKQSDLPAWIDCTSNSHCAPGYCCTIAYERYSYPHCQQLQEEGDFCRPNGPLLTNGTRSYPDELQIELSDVYLMFCPCASGLACDPVSAECRDERDLNLLEDNKD
ncbi:astakine-like [Phymastichus coffea]|uniref:astakine-like n=1 Tax=Phymastichus coffea TaxID=108790 RepID=UPI00273B95C1|nr:astakine-like [Phymastichus coffea]